MTAATYPVNLAHFLDEIRTEYVAMGLNEILWAVR